MKLTNKTMKSSINNRPIWPHGLVRTITLRPSWRWCFSQALLMGKGREAELPARVLGKVTCDR
jgi:hypothetical protein